MSLRGVEKENGKKSPGVFGYPSKGEKKNSNNRKWKGGGKTSGQKFLQELSIGERRER